MVGFGGYIINDKQNQLDDRIRSQELELEQRKQKFESLRFDIVHAFEGMAVCFHKNYKIDMTLC